MGRGLRRKQYSRDQSGREMILIEADVEHFSQGRQWVCLFQDGNIISAVYKHFLVKRVAGDKEGEFATKSTEDQVKIFYFPNHQLEGMDPVLLKDLKAVIMIASSKNPAAK